ncbi:uncharacterized protein Ecym_8033 [Eremothecium cymbalariae DBVPG|uniref:Impact N-terminal domain-containing protein n=1 Tax=Eremothecium cymbalariae (strain CBS 270.75 / DBVPG 7215 / KCTC 17166 / NRRL Y-17582) TaxID=931890 RepID=G8JWV5_ERECY|nr:Hypothetical protein Ecym_8033 [Eremothecium cymbalariae DBVPG\
MNNLSNELRHKKYSTKRVVKLFMALFALSSLRRWYSMRVWNESEVLVDRRSRFQGRCCRILSPDDVPKVLKELVESHKNVGKASHPHMYAWRTGVLREADALGGARKRNRQQTEKAAKIEQLCQGSADCGEAAAGSLLLSLLERNKLLNVIVIVTRWYGGTSLGSARFRHISSVAMQSLRNGEFCQTKPR